MKVSNEEIRKRSNTRAVDKLVSSRGWKWLGHILRMSPNMNPQITLTWEPEGMHSRDRQGEMRRRTVVKERAHCDSVPTVKWKRL